MPVKAAGPVERAGAADVDELGDVVAAAFDDLDVSRWLVADPVVRREIFPPSFRVFVEHALSAGLVHTTPDRDSVALWLPSGVSPPDPPHAYADRLAAITGPWIDRFLIFDEVLERTHPRGRPHHYLAMLAVRPDRQRQGLGTALLAAHHATLDAARLPAYLEASSERSRALYHRLGYVADGPPIEFPAGPSMFPMWRVPRKVRRR